MSNALKTFDQPSDVSAMKAQAANLGREISLARERMAGLQAAINSRQTSLARLQARIAMATAAPSQAAASVAR